MRKRGNKRLLAVLSLNLMGLDTQPTLTLSCWVSIVMLTLVPQ